MTNANANGPKTCVIFSRVSTKKQAEAYGLDAQVDDCRAWAEREGYRLENGTLRGVKTHQGWLVDPKDAERVAREKKGGKA